MASASSLFTIQRVSLYGLQFFASAFLFSDSVFSQEDKSANGTIQAPPVHSADILKCEICRKRLGLAPLDANATPQPPAASISNTNEQPDRAIQYQFLPLEIREKVLSNLDLPSGARLLSAQIVASPVQQPVPVEQSPRHAETVVPDSPRRAPPQLDADPAQAKEEMPENRTEQLRNEQANAEQPTKEQPSTEQPSREQPSREQPSTEQPSTEQPSTEQPNREQSSVEPSASQPVVVTQAPSVNPKKAVLGQTPLTASGPNESISMSQVGAGAAATDAAPAGIEKLDLGITRASAASVQIENEILKKQLIERDLLVQKLSQLQNQVESQMDQLSRSHELLRKQASDAQADLDKVKKESLLSVQKRDQFIANLNAELNNARAQSHRDISKLTDKVSSIERARTEEVTELSLELIELREKFRAAEARETKLKAIEVEAKSEPNS